ncbi:MAG: DUF1080 domain-containing protein [Verrucomicrobia bacterium]|nr:DUF1080 domain-containing protein [Verrucomicrobiota bacterium]
MKKTFVAALFGIILNGNLWSANPPEGFEALFNGRNLAGWLGDNPHQSLKAENRTTAIEGQQVDFHKHWSVENGELVNDGHGPYATTDRDYGDIELMLEYKTVAKADSGIYLRGSPQVQIWDTTEEGGKWERDADKGSGGLFNNPKGKPGQLPLVHADKPFGEWNKVKMRQLGSRTWVWLNGKLVVDGAIMHGYYDKEKPLPASGPIHLQTHGGEIRWRNIFVREIDAETANAWLREGERKLGYQPLIKEGTLDGWFGDKNGKEVIGDTIHWRDGSHIYTNKKYGDFSFRFEFIMEPEGNNGLAIRYPGEGAPAYDGMTELQILDHDDKRYATIDPRQAHGSAYGMTGAHRGYFRPYGEWNYEEVTVVGSTIRVELNGTVILDTDLSEIHEYMADRAHPGKLLTEGHLGFAGHGDEHYFQFRRLGILELN